MGEVADRDTLTRCAVAADQAGLDSLWVFDHVAIPPAESEGSGMAAPGGETDACYQPERCPSAR